MNRDSGITLLAQLNLVPVEILLQLQKFHHYLDKVWLTRRLIYLIKVWKDISSNLEQVRVSYVLILFKG